MYIKDGIAYAGEPLAPLKVHAFVPLNDVQIFNGVSLEFGCPVWNYGEIDIAPEYLYAHATDICQ